MTGQPRNLVSEFKRQLEALIGRECFELWFAGRKNLYLKGSALVVTADSEFSMDRIRSSYGRDISHLADRLGFDDVQFELGPAVSVDSASCTIVATESNAGSKSELSTVESSERSGSLNSPGDTGLPAKGVSDYLNTSSGNVTPPVNGLKSQRKEDGGLDSFHAGRGNAKFPEASSGLSSTSLIERGRQATSGLKSGLASSGGRTVRFSLNSFIFDQENQMVSEALKTVLSSPGEYNPLFLFGRPGCGKTHLLEGLAREARRRSRSGKVQIVTAEKFTSDYVGSLKSRTMPGFRKRYRELDYLLVDDLQFFAGKKSTLEELQHTIEAVTRRGGQVVVTSDRSPQELEFAGPEFINRVACGLTMQVQLADGTTKEKMVRQMASQKGLHLDEPTCRFIVEEVSGDGRIIAGALNRLRICQLISKDPLKIEDAKKNLADLVHVSKRTVTLTDIENAVCELFGLERKTLRSASKVKSVSQPRMLAMWLSRKHTRAALSEIGSHFGGRSHSTVLSAQSKVNDWMEQKQLIGLKHSEFPVENAIRRIEQELRIA